MKKVSLQSQTFEEREGYGRSVLFNKVDLGSNTKVQLMRLGPGEKIAPHYHKSRTEVFKLISGEGKIIINGEVAAASDDEMVLCNPEEVHEFINLSQSTAMEFLVIRTNDPEQNDMYWKEQ